MKLMAKVKLFWHEAVRKLTTYVALAITTCCQLAAHAEELLNQLPSLTPMLPKVAVIQTVLLYIASGLGLFAVWTRVRRLLKTPAPA